VRGTKGTFTKYGVDPQESQLVSGMDITHAGLGIESPEIAGKIEMLGADGKTIQSQSVQSLTGSYLDLYRNLAAAIQSGAKQDVEWLEATQVIELIELSHKSCKDGRTLDVPSLL